MGNNLIIRGGADFSGFRKELSRAQGSLKNFQSQTSVISKSCSKMGTMLKSAFALVGVASMIKFGKESSDVAKNVEASVGRINDIFGQSSKSIYDFYNQNKKSLGMSESAVLQYAATYGNLFSTFNSNQAANAAMTQKYLTATSVIASKTGRTVNDVAERIRSGLLGNTEAIEDLGINVNIKTIEITDAFKRIANGKSWLQLDAYQQAEVRQLAILEQATKKYGITVADNGAFATQSFSASIDNLKYTVGRFLNQAIIPAIKWLTIFFDKINEALTAMFGFNKKQGTQSNSVQSQADAIGAATDNQNKLTNAVKKTGKANENNLASFDSINVLAKSSSDSVDGSEDMAVGGGALSIPENSMEIGGNVTISPKIQQAVDFIKSILEPLKSISLDNLKLAFDNFKVALEPFTSTIFEGLKWAFDKLLVPLGKWVIEDALPKFLDVLSSALGLLNAVIEALKPFGEWLWETFLKPLAEWTGGFIIKALENLKTGLSKVSGWVQENQTAIENIAIVVGSFALAWGVVTAAIAIWNIVAGIGAAITAALASPITIVVLAIGALIAIIITLVKNWDWVKATAISCWEWIKKTWEGVAIWFDTNVVQPVGKFFSALWDGVAYGAKMLWYGIQVGAISMVNFVISAINAMIDGILTPFNLLIDAMNLLPKVDIPNIDFNIPTIKLPPMPHLATGAVIPPNREFMAVLGDQRNGTNIETPLDTMVQAFKMASANSGSNEIVIKFTGALSELVRILKPELDNESNRKGTRLVMG